MRGEGRAAAGGVPRRSGESLLSHGFAVPAPPEGKPRALRTVLAPRIYEGGGPRSGRGSPPQRRGQPSQSRLSAVTALPKGEPRALRADMVNSRLFYSTVPAFARFLRNSRPFVTCIRKIRRKVRIKSRRERIRNPAAAAFAVYLFWEVERSVTSW